jgi:hypothetical protein
MPLRVVTICGLLAVAAVRAENGYNAWLRYAPLDKPEPYRQTMPAVIATFGDSTLL